MGVSVSLQFALLARELVSRLVLVAPGLPDHEWSEEVERFGRAEEEALEAGDLERATELNLRTWVDGPTRSPGEVDPAVRRRVHDMQLRAFRTQVAAERPTEFNRLVLDFLAESD